MHPDIARTWTATAATLILVACAGAVGPDEEGRADGGTAAAATDGDGGNPGFPDGGTLNGNRLEIEADFCSPRAFPAEQSCVQDASASGGNVSSGASIPGNLGEALQKALWFFHANRSGPGVDCTYVQWRGDAHTADARIRLDPDDPNGVNLSASFIEQNRSLLDADGNGTVDLSGGFHDAGDYVKFGLTTAFAASTIAWSLWEYPETFAATGLGGEALFILRWFADYLIKSSFLDSSGNLVAFAHQVGDASDHTCGWMPPEVRLPELCPRRGYFVSEESPAADVTASAAAALALISLVVRAEDAAYADTCLKHAAALYAFASRHPDAVARDDGGLYNSEYAYDDLGWAAAWLFQATADAAYLDDALRPGGWLERFPGFQVSCLQYETSCWTESWAHCWNSLRSGLFLKLAELLQRDDAPAAFRPLAEGMRLIARDSSMRWPRGDVTITPGGFSFLAGWGSGRYNAAAQFTALVYLKHFGGADPEAEAAIRPWAVRQMAYLLGDNPLNKSYVMGFGDVYASQPHHPAGHASTSGQPDDPPENRHLIWGALVNGPSDASDGHVDQRSDYGANEVAIDYNAPLVAALAAHYSHQGQGQCPLAGFPPLEPPADEFYTRSRNNGEGDGCRSQVEITLINHSVHPPRYDENLSVRYYFNLSELQEQGLSVDDVTASLIHDTGAGHGESTRLDGPHPCAMDSSTYYYELGYQGYKFWGELSQLNSPRTVILELGVDHGPGCTWEPDNDFSYTELDNDEPGKSPHIPVYSAGELVWGEEPVCEDSVEKKIVPPDIPIN
jgi:endoglucanase